MTKAILKLVALLVALPFMWAIGVVYITVQILRATYLLARSVK